MLGDDVVDLGRLEEELAVVMRVGRGLVTVITTTGRLDEVRLEGALLAEETLEVIAVVVDVTDGRGRVTTAVDTAATLELELATGGFSRSYATASKTPLRILAALKSWDHAPLPSWIPNELVLLVAVLTARVFLAHARVLMPFGSSEPPAHSLQPLHSTSSCQ